MSRKVPDVFSTHSAAKFCRVTPMTIIRWIEEGRIRAYKTPGGHRRIMRVDLEDFSRRNGIPFLWEERVENNEVRRLLIVDDDKSTVDAILDAIFDDADEASQGAWEVEHTDNAFDAGRLVGSFRPDLVFVDVNLPGVDAARMARAIRTDPATTHARVVAITQDGTYKPVEFDDVINRPIAKKAVRRLTDPIPAIKG
jgi:excisionase family DNA binding protein